MPARTPIQANRGAGDKEASPAAGVPDPPSREVAPTGPPAVLRFRCPNWQKECDGTYDLVTDKVANNRPVWKMRGGEKWLYLTTDKNWGVGGQREFDDHFNCKRSYVFHPRTMGAPSPDLLPKGWMLFDGQAWCQDPEVQATALEEPGRGAEVAPQVTASPTGPPQSVSLGSMALGAGFGSAPPQVAGRDPFSKMDNHGSGGISREFAQGPLDGPRQSISLNPHAAPYTPSLQVQLETARAEIRALRQQKAELVERTQALEAEKIFEKRLLDNLQATLKGLQAEKEQAQARADKAERGVLGLEQELRRLLQALKGYAVPPQKVHILQHGWAHSGSCHVPGRAPDAEDLAEAADTEPPEAEGTEGSEGGEGAVTSS